MKIKNFLKTLTVFCLFVASVAHAAPFMSDSFESGSLTASNTTGFAWQGPNNTAVSSTVALDGRYGLRFLYPAGQAMSEQRFSLGTAYRDLWMSFWLRVPSNFSHGSLNNKLLAIWMDDYSVKGDGPTVVWESWGTSGGGSKLAVHWSEGGYTTAGSHIQEKQFISLPGDLGRWMQVVVHVRASTARTYPIGASSYPYRTDNDGVIELWRRWSGQSTFEKFHEVLNANIAPPAGGPNGWRYGYLMGWANSAYPQDTEFFIDDVVFSVDSLLTSAAASNTNPPSAPVLIIR